MSALARLLAKAKPQGPCFLCGPRNYARHRLWDSIDMEVRDGAGDAWIAENYAVSVNEVRDVRAAFAEARRKHRPLPGRAA